MCVNGLDYRKNFFIEMMVKYWRRFPREVVDSQLLFKMYLDNAFSNTL